MRSHHNVRFIFDGFIWNKWASVPISDDIIGYVVSLKDGWPALRATAPFLLSGRGTPTYTRDRPQHTYEVPVRLRS